MGAVASINADGPPCLGIDAGSTTLKVVVVEPDGTSLRARVYLRHYGDLAQSLNDALGRMASTLEHNTARVFVTGTAGLRIAERIGAPHLHEVPAVIAAALARHPDARSVIDLGGQDAKLTEIQRGQDGSVRRVHSTMNDRCAAGTGVTIDRCLARLGISQSAASSVRYSPALARPLSSKCGVFAETDLVNLARAGVALDVLVISLMDAVVLQNLALLTRGTLPESPIVLLGGVAVHLPALADAWRHKLGQRLRARSDGANITGDLALGDLGLCPGVLVPDDALFYGALGACLLGVERSLPSTLLSLRSLCERMAADSIPLEIGAAERPLARTPDDARRALGATSAPWPAERMNTESPGELVVGIDAGSTVFKAVALNARGELIAHATRESHDPVLDAQEVMREIERSPALGGRRVRAVGVTGYGSGLVAPVVGANTRVLETIAHARAARALAPDADIVCDVGGQDVKVLALDPAGAIRDFRLSSQCDAGLGLALEATARQLGVALSDIASRALMARRAPRFGDGCVVFLDADRVTFERQGYSTNEVLAGLVRAIPRLVWERIAHGINGGAAPRAVVLHGGVHRNSAVVLAQREHLATAMPDARVLLHPMSAEAGAIGAALCALDSVSTQSRRDAEVVFVTTRSAADTRCDLCPSGCSRTFIEVSTSDGATRTHVTGHACEAGAAPDIKVGRGLCQRKIMAVPNLLALEARALFARHRSEPLLFTPAKPLRIGIPRTLSMYRAAPFFRAYLEALGVRARDLVFSPATDDQLWRDGAAHGSTDPCFPMKVTLAHAHHLLTQVHSGGRRLDAILAPMCTHASIPVRHARDCASCPVVAASPVMLRAAFSLTDCVFSRENIRLLDGPITLTDPPLLREQLHAMFNPLIGASRALSDLAVERGFAAMRALDARLQRATAAVLGRIGQGTRPGPAAVLILCRPYHADPGVNHRLGEELQALGYPTLTIRGLPRDPGYLQDLLAPDLAAGRIEDAFDVRDLCDDATNSGALEKLWAARFAARHGRLGVIDLSSFKCAQDPPIERALRRVLDGGEVVTCALHDLDETRPVTSLRVRLATFAHALASKGLLPWSS